MTGTWAARNDGTLADGAVPDATPVPASAGQEGGVQTGDAYAVLSGPGSRGSAPATEMAAAFFCGGVLVIFVLLCYEAWLWKKTK
jgi:hypothetical protein